MTYIELINKVLKKLREETTVDVAASPYINLIGVFVNEAKREVEEAWDWTHLRKDLTVTTVSGTSRYVLTGLGEGYKILQVLNDASDSVMRRMSYTWYKRQQYLGTTSTGQALYWNINGVDTNGDPYVDIYPEPSSAETLIFNVVDYQDDLVNNIDELTVPDYPVFLGAYSKAVEERGEDGGQSSRKVETQYQKSLSATVARDAGLQEEETEWLVD